MLIRSIRPSGSRLETLHARHPVFNAHIYSGWQTYQSLLIAALADLTPDQLSLRAAPGLRTIADTTAHIVGARAGWFHRLLGEGGDEFAALVAGNAPGQPGRGMQAAIARWTPDDWEKTYPGRPPSYPENFTHPWVIWHLIEHDLQHGGEISLILGMHGLKAPDL